MPQCDCVCDCVCLPPSSQLLVPGRTGSHTRESTPRKHTCPSGHSVNSKYQKPLSAWWYSRCPAHHLLSIYMQVIHSRMSGTNTIVGHRRIGTEDWVKEVGTKPIRWCGRLARCVYKQSPHKDLLSQLDSSLWRYWRQFVGLDWWSTCTQNNQNRLQKETIPMKKIPVVHTYHTDIAIPYRVIKCLVHSGCNEVHNWTTAGMVLLVCAWNSYYRPQSLHFFCK